MFLVTTKHRWCNTIYEKNRCKVVFFSNQVGKAVPCVCTEIQMCLYWGSIRIIRHSEQYGMFIKKENLPSI